MTTNAYMSGRKKYQRPQAILFSENPGVLGDNGQIPVGFEIGANSGDESNPDLLNQFIILTDDNRQPIDFKNIRIEKRERMVNGRMRSHHIADKRSFSVSWTMVPSRSFKSNPNFNTGGVSSVTGSGKISTPDTSYTTDGGAGGVEIKDWYDNHVGSFWVFLAYDNYKAVGQDQPNPSASNLPKYNEVLEMFITDFSFSVQKRGGVNFDFWNISMTLEEV